MLEKYWKVWQLTGSRERQKDRSCRSVQRKRGTLMSESAAVLRRGGTACARELSVYADAIRASADKISWRRKPCKARDELSALTTLESGAIVESLNLRYRVGYLVEVTLECSASGGCNSAYFISSGERSGLATRYFRHLPYRSSIPALRNSKHVPLKRSVYSSLRQFYALSLSAFSLRNISPQRHRQECSGVLRVQNWGCQFLTAPTLSLTMCTETPGDCLQYYPAHSEAIAEGNLSLRDLSFCSQLGGRGKRQYRRYHRAREART